MAIFPGPDKSCLYIDPAAGLTDGGLWKDSSPYGLHCTPVGYAAPAYGIATGPSGAKMITFNGANQYGQMDAGTAARFYLNQPRTAITFALVARHNAPAVSDRIFAARTNAPLSGIELAMGDASVNRIQALGFDGAGTWSGATDTADSQLSGRTVVSLISTTAGIVAQTNREWHSRNGVAVSSTGGSGIPIWAVAVALPCVGSGTGIGNFFDGYLYHLSIFPFVFTHSEAQAFSDFWMDRT
jgi:hypothetical protein